MKPRPVRTFSSAGTVSRSTLVGGAALLVFAAVAWVVVAHSGGTEDREAALGAGRRVLSAAKSWQSQNGEGCPTLTELVEGHQLAREERTDDPWGNRYRVVCSAAGAQVVSGGPDGRLGTPDDLTIENDGSG